MKQEIAKCIALLTAEYDLPPFSNERIEMWMEALTRFPAGVVMRSTSSYVKSNKFKPQLADIVQGCMAQVPNAWMTADEAWALMPKSEMDSCMLTDETAQAMAAASTLLASGDRVAARMAFKGAYDRLVDTAKVEGRMPKFFPSLGTDISARAAMLGNAVKAGQLQLEAALSIAPDFAVEIVQLAGVKSHPLLAAPNEEAKSKVKALLLTLRTT